MINLKLLNQALGNVSTDEFAVLYFIANTISMKKEGRTRIYRDLIADKLGWLNEDRPEYALKKVTRITNSLVEKGYLIKQEVFESAQKSVNYYTLPTQKIVQKLTPSTQKNVPLNNMEKEIKKRNNIEKEEIKENKPFDISCDVSKEQIEEFCSEENKVPDVEDLGHYLKRTRSVS